MSDIRTSTAARERAVDRLRRHAAEGRLEVEELEDRVAAALRARTRGDLNTLFADLPRGRRRRRRAPLLLATPFLPVMVLMVAIWAVTGMGYFWPIWPIMGMAIPLVSGGAFCMALRPPRRRRLT